jgi:tRNA G10  N-methylase Trm11
VSLYLKQRFAGRVGSVF